MLSNRGRGSEMVTQDPKELAQLKAALLMVFTCFLDCGGAAKHVAAPNEDSGSDNESAQLDGSALSDEARVRFDDEKVKVVDSDSSPTSYAFENGHDELTQEEFAERYREVTGRTDLDDATRGKPGTASIVGGALIIGVALAGDIILLALSQKNNQPCIPMVIHSNQDNTTTVQGCTNDNGPAVDATAALVGSLGFTSLGVGGTFLLLSGIHSNRASQELSRDDAEDYARRYNRALLHKALRSPEASLPTHESSHGQADRP